MSLIRKAAQFMVDGKMVEKITRVLKRNPLLSGILNIITSKIYFLFPHYKREVELAWWKNLFTDKTHFYHWKNDEESLQKTFELYCSLLQIDQNSFKGESVVDIGCGPAGSLHHFKARIKFGIDPLSNLYAKNFNLLKHDMIYLNACAEKMPFISNSIDNVISDNSLDHVDSFEKTINEIHRVLKTNGKIIFCINLREEPTLTEPHIITYHRINKALSQKFHYKIIKKYPPVYGIPCQRVLIKGAKK